MSRAPLSEYKFANINSIILYPSAGKKLFKYYLFSQASQITLISLDITDNLKHPFDYTKAFRNLKYNFKAFTGCKLKIEKVC